MRGLDARRIAATIVIAFRAAAPPRDATFVGMTIQHALYGAVFAVVAACGDATTTPDGYPDYFTDAPQADAAPPCDPLAAAGQQGCMAGEMCGWIRVQDTPTVVGQVGCVPVGAKAVGATCARGDTGAVTGYDDCVTGAVCVGDGAAAICRELCDPAATTPTCPSSETCTTYPGLGGDGSPGMPMLGACAPT